MLLFGCYKSLIKSIVRVIPGYRIRRLLLRLAGYRVGANVYVGEDLIIQDELEDRGMMSIGDRAAIAARVTLVVSSHANSSRLRERVPGVHKPVKIGNDAWIGAGVIILPGVSVGRGSLVGAGSIVTKDVPDHTVVAGNPARILKIIDPCKNPPPKGGAFILPNRDALQAQKSSPLKSPLPPL